MTNATTAEPDGAPRIGILGGTFDPIHYGHLRIAEAAREAFGLTCVVFVPNSVSPFKTEQSVSPAEDRYAMTRLAVETNPIFTVSRAEIDRPGPSYAVDTVRHMRKEYNTAEALYFIVGADTVPDIPRWHEAEELLKLCRVIAVSRPGADIVMPGYAESLDAPGLSISGTDLRARVRAGRSIKYFVPEAVEAYLLAQKLYQP